ncbi:unnamed protein product [Cylicostephanus goldi]|uniref:Mos1 transposase HTH domain-containing protein n=1 Tax=Cylicostephanus goldi TaxID=71465 RepID=A0A3P7N2C1_CYLGO|nr:unnamed protein product [Cylicostephanus goldi]
MGGPCYHATDRVEMDKWSIRAIIFCEQHHGTSVSETTAKINDAFGPDTTNYRTVYNWYKRFDNGERSFDIRRAVVDQSTSMKPLYDES